MPTHSAMRQSLRGPTRKRQARANGSAVEGRPAVQIALPDLLRLLGRCVWSSACCRLLRTGLPKVRGCQSGLPTKRRREMTAAGKSQSKRDLFDRQFWLIDQQVARSVQPPVHHVAMRRRSCTLAECTFEVTGADPRKCSQLAQFDWLTERVLNVFENESEAAA